LQPAALDRIGIYARLGVPEVWRLEGDVLTFHLLQPSGRYAPGAHSRAFPALTANDLMPFLEQARQGVGADDSAIIRSFRAWLQQHRPASMP
jgi:hypothetical protein